MGIFSKEKIEELLENRQLEPGYKWNKYGNIIKTKRLIMPVKEWLEERTSRVDIWTNAVGIERTNKVGTWTEISKYDK